MGPGYVIFKLAMQLSPVLLVNGIAKSIPGGVLPIIAITEASHFLSGLLSGAANIELDDFFAHFIPLPGSTLVDNQVSTFPMANQAVAGNAIIQQPLALSMMMICPARDTLGYPLKLATMTALQNVLQLHISQGGTFTVVTPSSIYTNGLLVRMSDASNQMSKQAQNAYQMDFYFPLLTLESAQSVQNTLMSKISGGSQISSTGGGIPWSGLTPTVGSPNSLAGGLVIPSGGGLAATTSPFTAPAGGLT